ncbi:hypothetical protein SAMN06297280_3424 [Arsukibacterium tuosuense]|uniref:PRTase associated wHTH domain-containing protein n=1 Tax=Arsukibacterium tuosuense TaxID=1323745 RepID=A0A285JE18_9GAMM|nr:hypothetical protein [Arsukibacterium tuosuense]SNY58512.1 hypothetical protein SAMN06297280_3424 [Arsukibacterium tuosuense]
MALFVENQLYIQVGSKPKGRLKAILWPVLIHRVIYPEMRRAEANLFQRAVLALLRAKTDSIDSLAELTGLHEDLIRLVVAQCQANGWLAPDGKRLTESGMTLLDDEDEDSTDLKSGYVFQDAITGRLWPRFSRSLHELTVLNPTEKFPQFLESRQSGRKLRPYLINSKKAQSADLDINAFMYAYREYRDDFRAMCQLGTAKSHLDQIRLPGIQSVDSKPKSARVLVWLNVNNNSDLPFAIRDPFELRNEAYWLQDALLESVKAEQGLLKHIGGLLDKPVAEKQTVDEWVQTLRQQAEIRVLAEYPWLDSENDIVRYLSVILEWNEKLSSYSPHINELEAAVIDCQKLFEVFFQWLIKRYPADQNNLPKSNKNNWEVNAAALNALNIPSFSKDVVDALKRLSPKDLFKVISRPSHSLKTLMLAAAFGVKDHPRHPFKTLTNEQLQLSTLLKLADARNDSGHGNSVYSPRKTEELTKHLVDEYIKYSLDFITLFKDWM